MAEEDLAELFGRLTYEKRAKDFKSKGPGDQERRRQQRLELQKVQNLYM